MVPLANMFGYVNQLRSGTQGRANFTMQFDHYEQVPANIAVGDHREVQVSEASLIRRSASANHQKEPGYG